MLVRTFIGIFQLDVFENLVLNVLNIDFSGINNFTYEVSKYNWSDSIFWLYNFNI